MTRIVSKKNIPDGGDIVDDVKYNKARTLGCIIFDSGKKLFFHVNPVEFGKKKAAVAEVKTESVSREINPMDKNSPNDESYQGQVLEALARIRGVPIEEVRGEMSAGQDMGAQMQLSETATPAMEDFESRKASIMANSEERSRRLAEQVSSQQGGKLGSSFNGKNSISM